MWKKSEVPAYLHYGTNENIAPIVLLPDMGWTIGSRAPRVRGTHGFDPTGVDMQVIFRAVGPDFKQNYLTYEVFSNVNVYALLCHLLGVTPTGNDGSVAPFLKMMR